MVEFTVLLVDDEPPAREELRYLLEAYEQIKIVGEASSGQEAIEKILTIKPDVIFLDIQLSDMDGFEVAWQVFSGGVTPVVVFATAYDEYAVKAFEINALDYILKPFSEKRLNKTVSRLIEVFMERRQKQQSLKVSDYLKKNRKSACHKLSLWKNDRIYLICPQEICYCEAVEKGSKIKTEKGEFLSPYTLSELEEKIARPEFVRTHKSYLVNFDKVKEIIPWFNGTFILCIQGYEKEEVPVSRRHARELREMFEI
ncbi:MAG: two-component system, LytTR family, response regulator [Tepidanaerobacteraceae bacterium]|nr:two-component system, LytTR family, response regulator [Tepidanaerobacteraceae bacterium]